MWIATSPDAKKRLAFGTEERARSFIDGMPGWTIALADDVAPPNAGLAK